MTTLGQSLANRENAQKSTGPTTVEGKAASAMNGVTHGLRAVRVVLKGEDGEAFARLREQLMADLNPRNGEMLELADKIVALTWKRQRADRVETALWESGGATDGDMVVMLATHGKEIDRMMRYTREAARELAACRAEYRRLEQEYARRQVVERGEIDRMVEMRATITADMDSDRAERKALKEGLSAEACAAAAMHGWNEGYARVLRQARRELKREPVVQFRAGWELLGWDAAERAEAV